MLVASGRMPSTTPPCAAGTVCKAIEDMTGKPKTSSSPARNSAPASSRGNALPQAGEQDRCGDRRKRRAAIGDEPWTEGARARRASPAACRRRSRRRRGRAQDRPFRARRLARRLRCGSWIMAARVSACDSSTRRGKSIGPRARAAFTWSTSGRLGKPAADLCRQPVPTFRLSSLRSGHVDLGSHRRVRRRAFRPPRRRASPTSWRRCAPIFAGDPDLRRRVAFSVAMIALSAKMAKADGIVTQDEIRAFQQIFSVPPHETRNVARLYDLAKADVAGFEAYAEQDGAAVRFGQGQLRDAGGHTRRAVPHRQGRRAAARARRPRSCTASPRYSGSRKTTTRAFWRGTSISAPADPYVDPRHRARQPVRRGQEAAIASWWRPTIPTG